MLRAPTGKQFLLGPCSLGLKLSMLRLEISNLKSCFIVRREKGKLKHLKITNNVHSFSRPMNPPPVGAWRGSDDNGYISAEPSPGIYHMVGRYQ